MTTRAAPLRTPLPLVGAGPTRTDGPAVRTLVDEFLALQQDTTAVERFSQHHDGAAEHALRGRYLDLLPTTPPAPGQQYAFEVDLDACSGCKACVTACNQLNGLAPDETWRSVGLLVGTGERAVQQPVTTACHHCAEPGCLQGCPVNAYEKDPITGIVSHLDDQCIGCRYCTLTCPYEVPQFRSELGIVRKCDLCQDRLAVGEAPACVQSCPTQAISISVVDVETLAAPAPFPFAAPDPATTRPSTTFRTTRDLQTDVEPVDLRAIRPAHAHLPLTIMLVLTQSAVGAFCVLTALQSAGQLAPGLRSATVGASLLLALGALAASVGHLGRPLLAWRAVLGIGHSWLSREIVAFGAFAALGVGAALPEQFRVAGPWLAPVAAAVGLAALGTSVMVYVATGRAAWRLHRVGPRFLATGAGAGGAVAMAALAVAGAVADTTVAHALGIAGLVAAGGLAVALVLDLAAAAAAHRGVADPIGRTGLLLRGPLRHVLGARVVLGAVALGAVAVAWQLTGDVPPSAPVAAFSVIAAVAAIGGDLCERWWFFTAEADVRMPGARR